MKARLSLVLVAVLLLSSLLTSGVFAAGEYGSYQDPHEQPSEVKTKPRDFVAINILLRPDEVVKDNPTLKTQAAALISPRKDIAPTGDAGVVGYEGYKNRNETADLGYEWDRFKDDAKDTGKELLEAAPVTRTHPMILMENGENIPAFKTFLETYHYKRDSKGLWRNQENQLPPWTTVGSSYGDPFQNTYFWRSGKTSRYLSLSPAENWKELQQGGIQPFPQVGDSFTMWSRENLPVAHVDSRFEPIGYRIYGTNLGTTMSINYPMNMTPNAVGSFDEVPLSYTLVSSEQMREWNRLNFRQVKEIPVDVRSKIPPFREGDWIIGSSNEEKLRTYPIPGFYLGDQQNQSITMPYLWNISISGGRRLADFIDYYKLPALSVANPMEGDPAPTIASYGTGPLDYSNAQSLNIIIDWGLRIPQSFIIEKGDGTRKEYEAGEQHIMASDMDYFLSKEILDDLKYEETLENLYDEEGNIYPKYQNLRETFYDAFEARYDKEHTTKDPYTIILDSPVHFRPELVKGDLKKTVEELEKELNDPNGLVYRNDDEEGVKMTGAQAWEAKERGGFKAIYRLARTVSYDWGLAELNRDKSYTHQYKDTHTLLPAPKLGEVPFLGWQVVEGPENLKDKIFQPEETFKVTYNVVLKALWEDSTTDPTPEEPKDPDTPINPVIPEEKPGIPIQWTKEFPNLPSWPTIAEKTEVKVPMALNREEHLAYLMGYPNGTIEPEKSITRAEAATILFRLITDDVREKHLTKTNEFTDMAKDHWANTAISTMNAMGMLKGFEDETFAPEKPLSRAELATMCVRFLDKKSKGEDFSDTKTHWAREAIGTAQANHWILGYPDGSFHPDEAMSRAEVAALLNRVLDRGVDDEKDLLPGIKVFSDNPKGTWYYLDLIEATNSHSFTRKDNGKEVWKELLKDPDWSRFEK